MDSSPAGQLLVFTDADNTNAADTTSQSDKTGSQNHGGLQRHLRSAREEILPSMLTQARKLCSIPWPMDRLVTAMNRDHTVRVVAAITTDCVREAATRQDATRAESLVLARSITAGTLLATLVKNEDERVHLRLLGQAGIRTVIVDAYNSGRVRACLPNRQSAQDNNKAGFQFPESVTTSLGGPRPTTAPLLGTQGQVVVTRDIASSVPYEGSSDFVSGEIDEDVEAYLTSSEQLPSAVACDMVFSSADEPSADEWVLQSGGVLCQILPGTDPEVIERVRKNFADGALYKLLHQERTAGELIGFALGGEEFEELSERELSYYCQCGPENARRVLKTLGADDLEALAKENPRTEVTCSFCGDTDVFSAEGILEIANELRTERS